MILLIGLMLLLLVLGFRIAYAIGISSLLYVLIKTEMSPLVILQQISAGADSLVLLAVPFFLLAGELMNAGGITKRLVRFSLALMGSVRGGLSYVVILTNVIMAMVSGAAIASGAAVGSTMIPAMEEKGYPKGFAGAVNAAAATIGPVIPPSVGFIIFASLSNASVGKLFVAGAIPGLIIGFFMIAICAWIGKRQNFPKGEKWNRSEVWSSFKDAAWSLLMPVIILGGIITGIVTPTEAGVLAVAYGLFVGLFIHKDIQFKDLSQLFVRAARQTSVIMMIIACASAFGFLISREVDPVFFAETFAAFDGQPNVLMVVLIAIILVLGMVMEGGSIMIILTPLLIPILKNYGIDIIHFGVVFQLAIMIGLLTPPVGILLFVISGAGKVPVKDILKNIWPFYIALFMVLLLVAFIPGLSLWLVDILGDGLK
jgi:C4-dicarboxylate transporter DctM subunit